MSKKYYMCGREEWSCKDVGHPEIASVWGVIKKQNESVWRVDPELASVIMENGDLIGESELDENGENIDWTCYETYLVYPFDEEKFVKLLKNAGITFQLWYGKGEYLLVKDYYNMSNCGVETDIYMTDDYKKENCYD